MDILIDGLRTIEEVQQDFRMEFPFLKLEFQEAGHQTEKNAVKPKILSGTMKLGVHSGVKESVRTVIKKTHTVREVENVFRENFRLSVRVLRRCGTLWIETSLTDSWPLEQQNREGWEMSNTSSIRRIL